MKKEFLILIPDVETFCSTRKSFVEFLNLDSLITVSGQRVSYRRTSKSKDLVSARYHVETNNVQSKQERYFLLTLECQDEALVDEFSELCDRIKSVVARLSPGKTTTNTLWDDVGRIYAEKSYPVINEVENLMRRFIAKFMLITVGVNWSKDAMNPELFKKIESFEEEEPYLNDLHKLDFIHLKQVLFEKKRDIGLEELDRILLKTDFSKEDREAILKYAPKSNWEKYFSSLLEPKDSSIEIKWGLLYKLRNKVAHNRHVRKEEFETIKGLSNQIKEIVGRATAKLGEIDLDEQERTQIKSYYLFNETTRTAGAYEAAVMAYYSKTGPESIRILRGDDLCDFVVSGESGDCAVFVKVLDARIAVIGVKKFTERVLRLWFESSASRSFEKAHVAIVLREPQYRVLEQLVHKIADVFAQFDGRVTFDVGYLGDNDEYILCE